MRIVMPNWCSCSLVVSGPSADVNAFANEASTEQAIDKDERTAISLQKLFPCPPCLINAKTLGLHYGLSSMEEHIAALQPGAEVPIEKDDWYTWRVRNWGTKWDIEAKLDRVDPETKKGTRKIHYSFDSAWSPPLRAFKKISEDWPTLTFKLKYVEDGMDLKGTEVFHAGDAVDKNSSS